jgi:hypothetical protein
MQIGFLKNQNLLVTVVLEKKALKTHIFKNTCFQGLGFLGIWKINSGNLLIIFLR